MRELGIPRLGFTDAVNALEKLVPNDESSIPTSNIDLDELKNHCQELELPFEALIEAKMKNNSALGVDFNHHLDEDSFSALPLFRTYTWINWWIEKEYTEAGVKSPTQIINTIQKLLPTLPTE